MEMELEGDGEFGDCYYEVDADSDGDNEKCGICMDIIIDRGVLDCCQHWFCFGCIDNWGAITNLCPLCQNEFQLITCVPVYDTVGTAKLRDDSLSRDDDWLIQGKNNTLSFPSYYIDENAVICLDEDGCKIRNGMATSEDDANLDTSIACDSCDKWYHAFCVGFDPESTSEDSWLCPRCITDEESENSDGVLAPIPRNQIGPETASGAIGAALSGKLSVSIADAGETAVVVSMIEGKQWVEETREDFLSVLDINSDRQIVNRKNDIQPNVHAKETSLVLSSSEDAQGNLTSVSLPLGELKTTYDYKAISERNVSDGCKINAQLPIVPNSKSEPSTVKSNVGLHPGLFAGSSLSVHTMNNDETENHISGVPQLHNPSRESSLSVEKMKPDAIEDSVEVSSVKRKSMSSSYTRDSTAVGVPAKKAKADRISQQSPFIHDTRTSFSGGTPEPNCLPDNSDNLNVEEKVESSCTRDKMLAEVFAKRTLELNCLSDDSVKYNDVQGKEDDNSCIRNKIVAEVPNKKAKGDKKYQPPPSKHEINSFSRGRPKIHRLPDDSNKLNDVQEKEDGNACARYKMVVEALAKKAKADKKYQESSFKHETESSYSGGTPKFDTLLDDSDKLNVEGKEDSCTRDKMVAEVFAKKAKADRTYQLPPLKHELNSLSRGTLKLHYLPDDSNMLNDFQEKEDDNTSARNNMVVEVHAMKAKLGRKSHRPPLKHEIRNFFSGLTPRLNRPPDDSNKLNDVQDKKDATSDIMSIVRGTDSNVSLSTSAEKSSKRRDNRNGPRVKKIMRRAVEDESSNIVEKLRKEIREAVRNKAATDIAKSKFFDPKLLIAFRAAIAGPRAEQESVKRLNPSVVRAKKSMLQKGKTRESLTKKIYGTTNGRRKRAWDRDWEIEFWKHRCTRASKPEKIETLKSVLNLLSRNSESSRIEELEAPILSRLYLADTSVFPRKDDIKPLSSRKGTGNIEVSEEHNLKNEVFKQINDHCSIGPPTQTTKTPSAVCFPSSDKVKKGDSLGVKSEAACTGHPQDVPGKSDVKSDKRKWALEVLARKSAAVDTSQGNKKDNSSLKGNLPLLAQLPTEMRPVLAPSRHNKIPVTVRQAQLYRLTEHLLKKANVPVLRRTAETELAVADAVNIEKEVADRSSSKLVYVNLCSQALSQHMSNYRPVNEVESNPSSSGLDAESTELATNEISSDLTPEEALRMAGLVSDSPPNSPSAEDLIEEDEPLRRVKEDVPDNVLDMDTHGDLDIYGDFEYDLENEDFIGGSVLKVSKPLPEEGNSRLKLVFSTISTEGSGIVKAPVDPSSSELQKDGGIACPTFEADADTPCPQPEPLQDKVVEDPSLAEYEELYGPDKEPLALRFPEGNTTSLEPLNCRQDKAVRSELDDECSAEKLSVRKRSHTDHVSSGGENSSSNTSKSVNAPRKDRKIVTQEQCGNSRSVSRKVEAYIKEHIRPLCKSGVITVEQYRWAVGKTTEKIMRYHSKDRNANFLIKEGEKVKKLAEQYVEAAQKKDGHSS